MARSYKFTKAESAEHLETLKRLLQPGAVVYTQTAHVSRSGMQRLMRVFISTTEQHYVEVLGNSTWKNSPDKCTIVDITFYLGAIGAFPMVDRDGFGYRVLKVDGCGMDMGFHVVYNLSRMLFRDGHLCVGADCPSNDHSNPPYPKREESAGKLHHSDGGYALRQKWM